MLFRELRERHQGAGPVAFRLVRIDRGGFEHLAGGIDDGDLAAGSDAGIDAHHGFRAGGRREEQRLHVGREDLDGFAIGAFLDTGKEVVRAGGREARFPGDLSRFGEPGIGRAALLRDAALHHHGRHRRMDAFILMRNIEIELQHAFLLAAQQGQ